MNCSAGGFGFSLDQLWGKTIIRNFWVSDLLCVTGRNMAGGVSLKSSDRGQISVQCPEQGSPYKVGAEWWLPKVRMGEGRAAKGLGDLLCVGWN